MAFLLHSIEDGHVPAFEYLPCSAITPKVGMALTQTSGNLAIATGTTKPKYISMCEKSVACTAGDIIPVIRVDHGIIFEVPASADISGVNLGASVTLHASDGMQITATTSSGVAEIIEKIDDGSTYGKARVRF